MKQTIAIIILIALAMLACYTFFDSSGDKLPEKVVTVTTQEKQVSGIEKQYAENLARLTHENDSLKAQISLHKKALMLSRQDVVAAESRMGKTEVKIKTVRDTVLKLVYCDSLQAQVDSLVVKLNDRDSLCEKVSLELAKQVQNRDSVIADCQKSFSDLKSVADTSFEQQKTLTNQLQDAQKKLKRRTIAGRIMSAGLLVLSGIAAATLIIHH